MYLWIHVDFLRKEKWESKKPNQMCVFSTTCWYLDTLFHFCIILRLIAPYAYIILRKILLFPAFCVNCVFLLFLDNFVFCLIKFLWQYSFFLIFMSLFFFCPWFNFMPVVKWPSLTYVSSSRIILLPSIEKGRICDIQISTTEQEFWMLGSHTRGSSQGWEFAGKVSIW